MENILLGKELKELRIRFGKTQRWMAEQIGVTDKVYQWWETGRHAPSDINSYKLSQLITRLSNGQEV